MPGGAEHIPESRRAFGAGKPRLPTTTRSDLRHPLRETRPAKRNTATRLGQVANHPQLACQVPFAEP
jgi:hypothetical protein